MEKNVRKACLKKIVTFFVKNQLLARQALFLKIYEKIAKFDFFGLFFYFLSIGIYKKKS
jgi:hypothetical protein